MSVPLSLESLPRRCGSHYVPTGAPNASPVRFISSCIIIPQYHIYRICHPYPERVQLVQVLLRKSDHADLVIPFFICPMYIKIAGLSLSMSVPNVCFCNVFSSFSASSVSQSFYCYFLKIFRTVVNEWLFFRFFGTAASAGRFACDASFINVSWALTRLCSVCHRFLHICSVALSSRGLSHCQQALHSSRRNRRFRMLCVIDRARDFYTLLRISCHHISRSDI